MSTVGFEGFMQATVCAGMAPFTSAVELIIQVLFIIFIIPSL